MKKDSQANSWNKRRASGSIAESTVREDLKHLIRIGKIIRYRKSNKKEEAQGIDFFVTDLDQAVIPLQVKSNLKDQPKHVERYPSIPSISPSFHREYQRRGQLLEILAAYVKGEILHLTPHYKKPIIAKQY